MCSDVLFRGDDYVFGTNDDVVRVFFDDDVVVMQCIGLTDKSGRDVYEGDIIDDGNGYGYKYRVFWDDEILSFVIEDRDGDLLEPEDIFAIIGNIYETPELLEAKND